LLACKAENVRKDFNDDKNNGHLVSWFRWNCKIKVGFPWWTWVINLTGSLLLGIIVALHNREFLSDEAWLMLGVGFCGAYTTFSTFGYEMQQLVEKKHVIAAATYMLSSISLGVLLAWSGIVIFS
jgi:CrcB protein